MTRKFRTLMLIGCFLSSLLQSAYADGGFEWRDGKAFSVSPDRKWKVVCHYRGDLPFDDSENGYFLQEANTNVPLLRMTEMPRFLGKIIWNNDSDAVVLHCQENRNSDKLSICLKQPDGTWKSADDQEPKLQELYDGWSAHIDNMAFDHNNRLCVLYFLSEKPIKHGSVGDADYFVGVRRFEIKENKVVFLDEKKINKVFPYSNSLNSKDKEVIDISRLYGGGIFEMPVANVDLGERFAVIRSMDGKSQQLGYYGILFGSDVGRVYLGPATLDDKVIACTYKDQGSRQGDGLAMLVLGKKGTQPRLYLAMEEKKVPIPAEGVKPVNSGKKVVEGVRFYDLGQDPELKRVLSKAVDLKVKGIASESAPDNLLLICDEPGKVGSVNRSFWRVGMTEKGPNSRNVYSEILKEKDAVNEDLREAGVNKAPSKTE